MLTEAAYELDMTRPRAEGVLEHSEHPPPLPTPLHIEQSVDLQCTFVCMVCELENYSSNTV